MTNDNNFEGTRMLAAAMVLATFLAALVLARVADAQTVGTESLPGTPGAIAFASERDGADNFDVYRMNADGFGQTRITDLPGIKFDPDWSADGTKLTFSNRVVGETTGDVFQVGADGSGQKNLTNAPSDDYSPSYSPTNTNRFAFASNRTNNQSDVYLATLAPDGQTTELIRLTTNPAMDGSPAISPDGRRIAFVSDRDGDEDIYVMRLAPEGPRNKPVNLSKSPSSYDNSPSWSPDGKKIAFSSDRPAPDGTRDQEIWRMRATDGANPVNLTNDSGQDWYPAWQPIP